MEERRYLEVCAALADAGVTRPFEVGDMLARSYADIGFETFAVLTNNRLLSLQTGQEAQLAGDKHLFHLFVVDEILEFILKQGAVLSSLEFVDSRTWIARCRRGNDEYEARDGSLPVALGALLLMTLPESSLKAKGREGRNLVSFQG